MNLISWGCKLPKKIYLLLQDQSADTEAAACYSHPATAGGQSSQATKAERGVPSQNKEVYVWQYKLLGQINCGGL